MSENIIRPITKEGPSKKIHKVPTKKQIHKELCDSAHQIYLEKNADYGDSYAILRNK